MSDIALRVGFLADSHLGYAANCRNDPRTGLNMRVQDGYQAFRETVTQMLDADLDVVIHGGDTMHRSWPSIADIVWARRQLDRFAQVGIPVYGNTGNHDASAERGKSPATAALNDPDRNIVMLTNPYQRFDIADGVILHMISHYGLAQEERLLPEPVEGSINLLTAHGAALVPGHEIFHCADSPGEQSIGLDLLTNPGFALHLLGHYHGMGEIMPDVWYAGSSVRRGFSDPSGGRGWLLVNIHTDGSTSVEPQYISQRPQFDLPKIDAKNMTGNEVEEKIRHNLNNIDTQNAIVRQVVINCNTSVKRGIDQPGLSKLADKTLMWTPDYRRPEVSDETGQRTVEGVGASLKTAGSSNLPGMYQTWAHEYVTNFDMPEDLIPVVLEEGERHLKTASVNIEQDDYATDTTPLTSNNTSKETNREI